MAVVVQVMRSKHAVDLAVQPMSADAQSRMRRGGATGGYTQQRVGQFSVFFGPAWERHGRCQSRRPSARMQQDAAGATCVDARAFDPQQVLREVVRDLGAACRCQCWT
eukprot:2112899-Rhodomonas_salina.2